MVDDSDDYEEKPRSKKDEGAFGLSWGQIGAVAGGTALVGVLALGMHLLRPTFEQMAAQQNQQRLALQQQQQQAQLIAQQQEMARQQMQQQNGGQQQQSEELNLEEQAPQPQRRNRVKEVEEYPETTRGNFPVSV